MAVALFLEEVAYFLDDMEKDVWWLLRVAHTPGMSSNIIRGDEELPPLENEAQEAKEQLQTQVSGLERALVELDDGLRGWADKRVGECESVIQHWVEATLSGRINAMDKSLKKEMTERASTHDQVLDMITHNSERWCQLQAKFDELLVQVQKNNLSSFVSAGSIGSHGASTPVGSNFGGGSVVDISNGGPLAGRSSEDR